MEEPEINEEGEVVKGGMWKHQKAFWELDTFVKALIGGYGAAKTNTLCKRAIANCLENDGCSIAIVSPTIRMARRTVIQTMLDLLEGRKQVYGESFWYRHNKSTSEFYIKFRGRSGHVMVLSADNPSHLKGPNLASAYLDEPFIMDEAAFTQMVARVREPKAKYKEIGLFGCVKRNTKVLPVGGMRTIGSLDPGTLPKQAVDLGIDVLGLNNSFHRATKFWNNGVEETRKITTQNGYSLECTLRHPIWVMGEDGIPCWRATRDLRVGDRVAIGRGSNVWGDADPVKGFVQRNMSRRTNKLAPPVEMTNDLAYFLGLWTAEGSFEKYRLTITCGDASVMEWLRANPVCGITGKATRVDQTRFDSGELVGLMQHLGMPLVKAPRKWLADWVMRGRQEWALHFLAGMYDGDGHVCKDGGNIGYSTSSRRLAKDVHLMLLNLGVVSKIVKRVCAPSDRVSKACVGYQVVAGGYSAAKLAGLLPLRIARKREALSLYEQVEDFVAVPNQNQLILSAWKRRQNRQWFVWRELGFKKEPGQWVQRRKLPYEVSDRGIRDFLRLWDANEKADCEEIKQLRHNLADGYYWPKITELKASKCDTVDFVVPDTHSFWSNGFISHNTPESLGWGHALLKDENEKAELGAEESLAAKMAKKKKMTIGKIIAKTSDNKALDPEYIENLKSVLSEKEVDAYLNGKFVNLTTGRIYYAFDEDANVVRQPPIDNRYVEWGAGIDFNVNPMSAVVFWRKGDHVHVVAEYLLENSDTELLASKLLEKHPYLVNVYPDPAGRQRKTSSPAGKTDFHYLQERRLNTLAPAAAYGMRDSINIVNGKFRPSLTKKAPTLTIDPSCKKLIEALNVFSWELAPRQEKHKHVLDALRYPMAYLFPLPTERDGSYALRGI